MRRYSLLKIIPNSTIAVPDNHTRIASSQNNIKSVLKRKGKSIPLEKGHFYNVVSAMHGDAPNGNGDYFEWKDELLTKKTKGRFAGKFVFQTWNNAPVHLNHDPAYTCGFVADTVANFSDKSIDMVMATNIEQEPELCRKIQAGIQTDVSMGTNLEFSLCSHCGNLSYEDTDWCACLTEYKARIHPRTGKRVYEILKGCEGCELSHITVGEGADFLAKNKEVLFAAELSRRGRQALKNNLESYYKKVLGIR